MLDRRLSWPGRLAKGPGDLPVQRRSPLQYYPSITKTNYVDVTNHVSTALNCQNCSTSTKLTQQHTHLFNGPLSRTTRVSRYQKGKTNLDFTEARDSEWQWHQLGHMQVCTSLQTDSHASTPPISFFTGQMPFLPPNQQRQNTAINCRNSCTSTKLTQQQSADTSCVATQLTCLHMILQMQRRDCG